MSSSISSSDGGWRRFFWLAAGTAAVVTGIIYAFVVLVDPWDILPLSPPLDRVPVSSNQRFSYPSLARSPKFDSAVFGTSSSRLLPPATLNAAFHARFANLAMNAATAYEQVRLMLVFLRAHPEFDWLILGLDISWCETGDAIPILTRRQFPEWMYEPGRWRGYGEMLNMYAVQEAGKEFGFLTHLKPEDQGRDGYTIFVPPDDRYDRERAAAKLRADHPVVPKGDRAGPPAEWRFAAFDRLKTVLEAMPGGGKAILYFVPYNRVRLTPEGHPGAPVWAECKRRSVALAGAFPNVMVVDFLKPSPITLDDSGYWDARHYRVGVGERVASDLAGASRVETSPDYDIIFPPER